MAIIAKIFRDEFKWADHSLCPVPCERYIQIADEIHVSAEWITAVIFCYFTFPNYK